MSDPLGWFARGLALGSSIAAPVGPIGVLCVRRTLAEGRLAGVVTGLGAATADALYGAVAAFGLTAVTGALVGHQHSVRLVGGLFLLWLGVHTFASRPAERAATATGGSLLGDFGSTFVLTLTNPMTILSFAAVFAGLGLGAGATGSAASLALIAGVLFGSAAWWLLLCAVVGAFRGRFDVRAMRWVNRASGAVIAGFGLLALSSPVVGRP